MNPDEKPKRKHRATGKKPPGGARPGAGRPPGTLNALRLGEVKALKVANLRVPESATDDEAQLAGIALSRMVDVMLGNEDFRQAPSVLKAATAIREEICKPVAQKIEHTGADGGQLVVEIHKYTDSEED